MILIPEPMSVISDLFVRFFFSLCKVQESLLKSLKKLKNVQRTVKVYKDPWKTTIINNYRCRFMDVQEIDYLLCATYVLNLLCFTSSLSKIKFFWCTWVARPKFEKRCFRKRPAEVSKILLIFCPVNILPTRR